MPLIIQMWSILCGFWNRTFLLLLEGEMGVAYTTDKIPLHVTVKF